jgi:hypothetical protein
MKRVDGEKQQLKVNYGKLCVVALLCSPSTGVHEAERHRHILGQWGGTVSKPEQCNIREKSKQN